MPAAIPIRVLLCLLLAMPAMAQTGPRGRRAEPAPPPPDAAALAQAAREVEQRLESARIVQQADALHGAALDRAAAAVAAASAAAAEADRRGEALSTMLPVLRRLALYPAETLLASPGAPEDAVRATLVLRSLARHLWAEAAALRLARQIAAETAARAVVEADRLALAARTAREEAERLDAEIESARPAPSAAERAASEQAQRVAARAADVPDMLARLPRRTPTPAEIGEQGIHPMPVAGRITRGFGVATDAGPARGVTLAAPPGARVVAPCTGRVAFAGPFRSYGELVILDCGEGVHAVLAGLARIDQGVGSEPAAGEALGVLGEASSAGRALLYLEIRRNGQPADPRAWLDTGS